MNNGTATSIQKQQGAVLILLVMGFAVILVALWLRPLLLTVSSADKAMDKTESLYLAKQHLLAYALRVHLKESSRADRYHQVRLGELPCPDFNNDAQLPIGDYGVGGQCRSLLGWLPWKTLRMDEMAMSVHPIWYAVDAQFSNRVVYGSVPIGGINEPIINSSTVPALQINGQPMAAVLIAAEEPLSGQNNRSANNASVAVTSFLEDENANINLTQFVQKTETDNFNDRVIGITADEIIEAVEHHAVMLIANRLNTFYRLNGDYPHAGNVSGICDSGVAQVNADVPQNCSGASYSLNFPDASSTTDEDVWLARNLWLQTIRYTRVSNDAMTLTLHTGKSIRFYQGQRDV